MAGTILLTGASGYVGSRLLQVLEEGGCAVRCLARQPWRVGPSRATTAVVAGDCLDEGSLVAAMDGIDQAYYLVHSMASGPGFAVLDRRGTIRASTTSASTPLSRWPSGAARAGSIGRIRADGFSGTAGITSVAGRATMRGRFGGGVPCRGTSRPFGSIVTRETSTAGGGSARQCCTGRMTAASSDILDDAGRRPIRVGISACLMGDEVRFDGGHKRDAFLTETFGRFVEWVPVCPEVECGLGKTHRAADSSG